MYANESLVFQIAVDLSGRPLENKSVGGFKGFRKLHGKQNFVYILLCINLSINNRKQGTIVVGHLWVQITSSNFLMGFCTYSMSTSFYIYRHQL